MDVFVTVQNPSDVLFYQEPMSELKRTGHSVTTFLLGTNDWTEDLLKTYGIPYIGLGEETASSDEALGSQIMPFLERLNPAVITGVNCPGLTAATESTETRSVVFRDTPPTEGIDMTGASTDGHTAGFVLPNRYEPAAAHLENHDPEKPYFVLGIESDPRGKPDRVQQNIISYLSDFGTVYSTDGGTDTDERVESIPANAGHDFLAFADIYVGDSVEIARETGLLGTPTICRAPDPERLAWTLENLNAYGLVDICDDTSKLLDRVERFVPNPATTAVWEQRRRTLLYEQYDQTAYTLDALGVSPAERGISERQNVGQPGKATAVHE